MDTSKNQCSSPAVTALKKLLPVLCLQFISTKERIKCIPFIIIIGYLTGTEENKRVKCAAVNCRSGFSPTKKEKEVMSKGITCTFLQETCVCLSEKKVTRRLWLSAIHRDADSFNPEHSVACEFHFKAEDFEANYAPRTSTARVRVRLKPKAVHSVFVKYMFKHFLRRKRVNRFVNSHFI